MIVNNSLLGSSCDSCSKAASEWRGKHSLLVSSGDIIILIIIIIIEDAGTTSTQPAGSRTIEGFIAIT